MEGEAKNQPKLSWNQRYPSLLKMLYYSTVQMIFLGIANSLMGILSQLTHQNGRDWAGPVSTMLLFLFSGVGTSYTRYFNRYKFRTIIFFSALGYTLYVGSSIVFVLLKDKEGIAQLIAVFLLTMVSGLILSAYYMAQFYYTSLCCYNDSTSIYFGVNLGISQCADIIGNLLSAWTIVPLGELNYCIMMTVLIVVVATLFLFVKEPCQRSKMQEMEKKAQELVKNRKEDKDAQKGPLSLFPSYLMTGVTITFIYCLFSTFMYLTFKHLDKEALYKFTFELFIVEGVGQFIGGLWVIFLSDRYDKFWQLRILNKTFLITIVGFLLAYQYESEQITVVCIFMMGFVNSSAFATNLAIIEKQGWGRRGYVIFNYGQTFGVVASIAFLLAIGNHFPTFFLYMSIAQMSSCTALSYY